MTNTHQSQVSLGEAPHCKWYRYFLEFLDSGFLQEAQDTAASKEEVQLALAYLVLRENFATASFSQILESARKHLEVVAKTQQQAWDQLEQALTEVGVLDHLPNPDVVDDPENNPDTVSRDLAWEDYRERWFEMISGPERTYVFRKPHLTN